MRQVQGVVKHGFVVLDLLEGQRLRVGFHVTGVAYQFARILVTFTLHDAGCLVEGCHRQVTVSPPFVETDHKPACPFRKLRAWHIAVGLVLVGMGILIRKSRIPHKALLMPMTSTPAR